MNLPNRQHLTGIVLGICGGLLFLNFVVLGPMTQSWSEQSDRIAALRAKVDNGRSLLDREDRIRNVWAAMLRTNLPADESTAEANAFTAVSRWQGDSGISVTSLTPQWQSREDEGYDTFEFRAAMTGDQVSLGRFLYELGTDPMPCNLEECEISTRDAHGQQLNMAARFSFVRVSPDINAVAGNSGSRTSRGGSSDE